MRELIFSFFFFSFASAKEDVLFPFPFRSPPPRGRNLRRDDRMEGVVRRETTAFLSVRFLCFFAPKSTEVSDYYYESRKDLPFFFSLLYPDLALLKGCVLGRLEDGGKTHKYNAESARGGETSFFFPLLFFSLSATRTVRRPDGSTSSKRPRTTAYSPGFPFAMWPGGAGAHRRTPPPSYR